MRSFFKTLSAAILALFIGVIIIIAIAYYLVDNHLRPDRFFSVPNNSVLVLKLQGRIQDRDIINPIDQCLGTKTTISLRDYTDAIKKATENKDIKGIYIDAGALLSSAANIREIRNELLNFKNKGKFVVSYGDVYTQGAYYLSSVSDKIVINPYGNINFIGMAATPSFKKEFYDKIGINFQIFKVGRFKSAVESSTLSKMSDANRLQVQSYLNDMWFTVLKEISESRNINVNDLDALADTCLTLRQTDFLLKSNMVDDVLYKHQISQYIEKNFLKKRDGKVNFITISNLKEVDFLHKDNHKSKIAVLYAEGEIFPTPMGYGISHPEYVEYIDRLGKDKSVKAVVLRINSPGGSSYSSEQIWESINVLKKFKPVVVSMGGMAASGGYYMACNADKIFAQPNTLTGSIGIYAKIPMFEGLFTKIGIAHDVVKTNEHSDIFSFYRDLTPKEVKLLQKNIDLGYELFLDRCSKGRGLPVDTIDLVAHGRVWTGRQAVNEGLVDELGGLDDAINYAAILADIEKYSVDYYPNPQGNFKNVINNYSDNFIRTSLENYFGNSQDILQVYKEIQNQDYIQTIVSDDAISINF